jgi:hypothetical protein
LQFNYISDVFKLDTSVKGADIIADVTILEWLGEGEYSTFFRARVNRTIYGKEYEEIEIALLGNSKIIVEGGSPLFINGDRLLLFFRGWEDSHVYNVIFHHIFSVIEQDGVPYILDRRYTPELWENETVQKINGNLRAAVNENLKKHDPFLTGRWRSSSSNPSDEMEIIFEGREHMREELAQTDGSLEIYESGLRHVYDYEDVVNFIVEMARGAESCGH